MYFSKFPKTYYSLDNRQTVQIVPNILLRIVFSQELKDNYSVYDEYDIVDGDTPEIVAYKLYGDSNLHWIVLLFNEILDPRFEWVLDTYNLNQFVAGKYQSPYGIHHYEDLNGNIVNGNVLLTSSISSFANFETGDVVVNSLTNSVGFISTKVSNTSVHVITTKGGFQAGDTISLKSNSSVLSNITSTTIFTGIPVTNLVYEDVENENRRRIKVLKPQFVQKVVKEFESKINDING